VATPAILLAAFRKKTSLIQRGSARISLGLYKASISGDLQDLQIKAIDLRLCVV